MKLAIEIIRGVSAAQLSLRFWQGHNSATETHVSEPERVTCGTIACAAGWLALSPAIRKEGLAVGLHGNPQFSGHVGFLALARFFEISYHEARVLFNPRYSMEAIHFGTQVDKEIWLRRIEMFTSSPEKFKEYYIDGQWP
jgi:hypothetical protein